MTYNPRQTFEPGRGSIYSSYKPPSRSNANKQAASSMASVGIGGLSGKPTTSAAKRIQDKFRKETQKDNNRNTGGYDPVGGGSIDDPGYKGPGLGSNPNTGNDKDDSSSQDTFIDTLMKKVKSSFNFAGGTSQNDEPTDPDPVSVYTADVFASPVIQVGYENPNDMRSGEEIATDIARMFDRSKDKGYYQYSTEAGSRYDEVPAASANKNLEVNKTKSAVERFLKEVIAPDSKEYKIKKNDTLSAIALREGITVADLVKVNGIKDKDRIYTDETLIIPESKDMQKVKDFVDSIDPDAEFSQSGVPMDQREFAPEDTSELNNPQTQQGLMSTDPVTGYDEIDLPTEAEVDKKIKGLGARPDVTVTELDDVGVDDLPEEGILAAQRSNVVYSDPEMDYIVSLEQFRENPYELNSSNLSPTSHKSGLTVANGFDVGQHDRQVLVDMGLSDTTINKFGDFIGLNPDTVIDPNTGRSVGSSVAAANRFETVIRDGEPVRVPTREWTAARTRGHTLMTQTFETAQTEGTLPSFTRSELEQISKGSYKTFGTDVAKRDFGEGYDDLAEDVKAALVQEAYVRGSVSDSAINSAREGANALTVLDNTASSQSRKDNARDWLNNNSFDDDPKLSKQGIQILTNEIINEKGLDIEQLEVDSIIGPNTRRTVNQVLRDAGKTPPAANASGDARRKELLEDVLIETLMPPTEED